MMFQQREIIEAIRDEIELTGRERQFKVANASMQKNTIRIELRIVPDGGHIDYTLEGGTAIWESAASTVVTVSVDESLIYVHRLTDPVPRGGDLIRIRPPRFLDALLECWVDDELSTASFSWAAKALVGRQLSGIELNPTFLELRERQKAAYALLGYRAGFLWGPPGTGKTRTAASMVADLVIKQPASKVLLIAPTNAAVDQLLIAVDNRLASTVRGQFIREHCARLGSNFCAGYYTNRLHLLPQTTDELLFRKAKLEANQPEPEDPDAMAAWKREMEELLAETRSQLVSTLLQRRVFAMTAALASMHFKELRQHAPFTQLVFDEASQIGRAVALMLAPLADQVVIAGDPKQLAPIHSATQSVVEKWLGRTLFDEYMHQQHPSTCLLNEQSRMAALICKIVSSIFYKGELRVSTDCLRDPIWSHDRRGLSLLGSEARNVHLIQVHGEATPHGGSHWRPESAEIAVQIARELVNSVGASSVLILTPFVPQKKLIKDKLKLAGLSKVRVSTVHGAQGAEKHSVIFDPVKGDSRFLQKRQTGPRLINVAMSRARGCLVLLLSAGDCKNPVLADVAELARNDNGFQLNV